MDKLILMILISSLTVMPNTFVKCAPRPGRQEIPETADDELSPAGHSITDPHSVFDTESEEIPDESPLNTDNKALANPTKEDGNKEEAQDNIKEDQDEIESNGDPELQEATDAVSDINAESLSDDQKSKESENLELDQDESVEEGDRDLYSDLSINNLNQGKAEGAGDNSNDQVENPNEYENGATLDESHDTVMNDDIDTDSTPATKDTSDEDARGDAKKTLDKSLEVIYTTRKPQTKEESEEDDHHELEVNPKKQPKDSDTDLSNEENDDGPEEAPLITASTLEKSQVSPSALPTPVKASTSIIYSSTKRAAISTRSTTENDQPNTEGRTSRSVMPNLPTSHGPTTPDVPHWSSLAPSMSTAGLQQPGKPTLPWFYHTGPSSRPLFRNDNYGTSPHRGTSMTESEPTEGTTPETSTGSPLGAATTTATYLDINPETTPQPSITSTSSTTTEEFTTTSETASETTRQVELIVPDNMQTEANPALEYTTTFAGVVVEPTTSNGTDGPHDRKRPPVKIVSGREGESSVLHEGEEKVEKESTKPTTTTADETTSTYLSVSVKPGVIKYIKKYSEELVKQVGAFKFSLILLTVVALSFVSLFVCCKLCKRKGYRMRQRKLKEFGQEKDFLLRDCNKGNKYNNDRVTLLEGSSEDEF